MERRDSTRAFSLVEVVIAIGVLSVSIVALLGLLPSSTRDVGHVVDSSTSARLVDAVASELDGQTFATLQGVFAGGGLALRLVANRDGSVVVQESVAATLLPNVLDRYFLLEISGYPDNQRLSYSPGNPWIVYDVTVSWPFQQIFGAERPTNVSTYRFSGILNQ